MEPLHGTKLYKERITNQDYNMMMSELMVLVVKYEAGEDVDTDRVEYIGELFDMAEEEDDEWHNFYKEYLELKKERENEDHK